MSAPREGHVELSSYGPHERQIVEEYRPPASAARSNVPVVTLIHGGYWRNKWRLDLMHALADDLVARGHDVRNIEYRSVGDTDTPWPDMQADVLAATRMIGQPQILVGHSAGGHLALWAAKALPGLVRAVVALAPVSDLGEAFRQELSDNATNELLGAGPEQNPELYALASPIEQLPIGVPQLVVHGKADDSVPPVMSNSYVAAARRAGDDVNYLDPVEVDHFHIIDPTHAVWKPIGRWLGGFG